MLLVTLGVFAPCLKQQKLPAERCGRKMPPGLGQGSGSAPGTALPACNTRGVQSVSKEGRAARSTGPCIPPGARSVTSPGRIPATKADVFPAAACPARSWSRTCGRSWFWMNNREQLNIQPSSKANEEAKGTSTKQRSSPAEACQQDPASPSELACERLPRAKREAACPRCHPRGGSSRSPG